MNEARSHKLKAIAEKAYRLVSRASGPITLYALEQGSIHWTDWQALNDALAELPEYDRVEEVDEV